MDPLAVRDTRTGATANPGMNGPQAVVAGLVGATVASIGVIGAVVSFDTIRRAVEPSFGHLAPMAPVGVDLGILTFAALDLLLAWRQRRLWWLRLVPWTLIATTIYLNVAHPAAAGDPVGAVAHAVLPGLWAVAVEVTAHVIRHWAGVAVTPEAQRATGRMDRIRFSRWLLAPVSTLQIRRLMILWEERSYAAALDRWIMWRRAKAALVSRHGLIRWRWRAPYQKRLDLRLARLSPAAASGNLNSDHPHARRSPTASTDAGRRTTAGRRSGARATDTGSRRGRSVEELLPIARPIYAAILAAGETPVRDILRERLNETDIELSNDKLAELVKGLKANGTRAAAGAVAPPRRDHADLGEAVPI